MVSTGWLQWPNWMVDYTLGLVPHNLFYARRKAIFMPVIDIKAFFQSCVFPICWAYCLSCPIVLAGGFPRKGEQSSTPWRKISFFCIPYRLHIKSLCGYITGAGIYCSSRLAIFCTCRKKVGMGNGIIWSCSVLILMQLEKGLHLRIQWYTQVLQLFSLHIISQYIILALWEECYWLWINTCKHTLVANQLQLRNFRICT